MLILYKILTLLLYPVMAIYLFIRAFMGKEDLERIGERFGYVSQSRPLGSLVWIHAASVGESMSVLPLIERMIKNGDHILVTSGTISSAKILARRLPKGAVHQFLPMDNIFCVRRFLSFWHPNLLIIVESELWPIIIEETANICPTLLLIARMSQRSFRKWGFMRAAAEEILGHFSVIVAQSKADQSYFSSLLGSDIHPFADNLKYSAARLRADENEVSALRQQIGNKKILLAVSTHRGDDEIIIDAYLKLRENKAQLFLVIIPRHKERAGSISMIAKDAKLQFSIRSKGEQIHKDSDVYIADTMGELGIFFTLADIVFIAGSFKNGGHNPIEAAHFSRPIIFGSDMSNFMEIADGFIAHDAAIQLTHPEELHTAIEGILKDKIAKEYAVNAKKFVAEKETLLEEYIKIIENNR